jgi:hypothetical protein
MIAGFNRTPSRVCCSLVGGLGTLVAAGRHLYVGRVRSKEKLYSHRLVVGQFELEKPPQKE